MDQTLPTCPIIQSYNKVLIVIIEIISYLPIVSAWRSHNRLWFCNCFLSHHHQKTACNCVEPNHFMYCAFFDKEKGNIWLNYQINLFPNLSAQGEIPASGSMHPHTGSPLREKTKSNRGDPALHLYQARGHLNWRMGLPALLGSNLGCWIM